jgi:hypothetical protein
MTGMFPPLPAPPLLLSHLLGAVFVAHILFLDFVIASPLLALWYLLQRGETGRQFSTWLSSALPVMFTFAINFGVASLLFVQALFAERFYTANIFLGLGWLAVIALLLLAFYGAYIARNLLRKDHKGGIRAGAIDLIVTAMVWSIAGIMIANYFITASQDQRPILMFRPWTILGNLTFAPRAFHFLIGAFGVTGFWMVWISWWRENRGVLTDQILRFRRHGLQLAAGATGLQVIVGVWFLIWLPSAAWDQLFNGNFPGIVWISGVAGGLIMLGVLIVANVFPDKRFWQRLSTGLLLWTLAGMVAGRDVVRLSAFGKDFRISSLPSTTQPSVLLMFFIVLSAGVLSLVWLLSLLRKKPSVIPGQAPLSETK